MTQVARAAFARALPPRTIGFVAIACLLAATPLFAQSDWSASRANPMVTVELRRLVGLLMLGPAVTLFLLYLFRRRPYVLAGATAWAAASIMMLVFSFESGPPNVVDSPARLSVGRTAVAIWAVAAVIFGGGIRLASLWFRAPARLPRTFVWSFPFVFAWTVIAAPFLRPVAVILPAFLMMTIWQALAAATYFRVARAQQLVGPLITGLGVAGMVAVNTTALAVAVMAGGIGAAATRIAYLNFISAAVLILGMHLLIFEDVIQELRRAASELAKSHDEMKAMANTDPLTKCYNRRFLYEIADRHLEQHRRYTMPLSLLYIDIDHFKAINDQLGHKTGDEVLKTVGAILNELTRKGDYVFRWGGDEFLVLLSATEEGAKIKCNQIRRAFLESVIVQNLPDGVDVSIGIVPVPPERTDLDALIDQADREMYRRKRALGS
jgi:diguanylate cyclase (GGDEF)-like protein